MTGRSPSAAALEFSGALALAVIGSRRLVDFLWIALVVLVLAMRLPADGHVRWPDPLGTV